MMNALFTKWKKKSTAYLKAMEVGLRPKDVISEVLGDEKEVERIFPVVKKQSEY